MKFLSFVFGAAASLSSALQMPLVDERYRSFQPSSLSTTAKSSLPGGSPFSLCPVSRPSDLFNITSLQLSKQPLYIDDDFLIHTYGTFSRSFSPNATLSISVGYPDNNETLTVDFCESTGFEQPLHGRKSVCPPEPGYALLSNVGYIIPMFFQYPGWYNFTIDVKTHEGDRIYCVMTEVCLRYEDPWKNGQYPPGPWTNCTWPG